MDTKEPPNKEFYTSAMVLSGVGDALGYKDGDWEFNYSGSEIHKELKELGGLKNITLDKKNWCVSDDTVMHLATADALIEQGLDSDTKTLYSCLAKHYKLCMADMDNRAPGTTSMTSCGKLRPDIENGHKIPFNSTGVGCGAAMRAMCIGLRYPFPEDIEKLREVGIESGRMTHHHPTGYLGSLTTALFTSYAIQRKEVKSWGALLTLELENAKRYILSCEDYTKENEEAWSFFESKWSEYLRIRNIVDGSSEPQFPPDYDVDKRDVFYKSLSYNGWGGSSGHDAPMIAYDALLGCNEDWEELCNRAMFHGGDNDSTGAIAGCWYGALYGFKGVPENLIRELEYRERMEKAAENLYSIRFPASDNEIKTENIISCAITDTDSSAQP